MANNVLSGIMGLCVADALGVPVEFFISGSAKVHTPLIHNILALTYAHKRSKMACGIYISVALMLTEGMDLKMAVRSGIYEALKYYGKYAEFTDELRHFERLERKKSKNSLRSRLKAADVLLIYLKQQSGVC